MVDRGRRGEGGSGYDVVRGGERRVWGSGKGLEEGGVKRKEDKP